MFITENLFHSGCDYQQQQYLKIDWKEINQKSGVSGQCLDKDKEYNKLGWIQTETVRQQR